MEIIWHYTTGLHIEKIIQEKRLRVSEVERMVGLKPAVWFSKNQLCEPTALKFICIGSNPPVTETMKVQAETIGLLRIGIEFTNELTTWAKYKHVSKITQPLYNELEQSGIANGADPNEWFCSFKNIPSSKWITIERFNDNKWESFLTFK